MKQVYEVLVIGGGPAGVAAAMAIGRRRQTALIDQHATAGPAAIEQIMVAAFVGAVETGSGFEAALAAAHGARDSLLHQLPQKRTLQAAGVAVVTAQAAFTAPFVVTADNDSILAKVIVIATGSQEMLPILAGPVQPLPVTTIWKQSRLPKRLAVVGPGSVDNSVLQALTDLGSRVNIITDQPLSDSSPRQIVPGVVGSIERLQRSYRVNYHNGPETASLGADLVIATGLPQPRLMPGLRLAGIDCDANGIVVDNQFETSRRHCYAIGSGVANNQRLMTWQQGQLVGSRIARSGF